MLAGRLDKICQDPRSYVARQRRNGDNETEFICVAYQIPKKPMSSENPELRLHVVFYFSRTPPPSYVALESTISVYDPSMSPMVAPGSDDEGDATPVTAAVGEDGLVSAAGAGAGSSVDAVAAAARADDAPPLPPPRHTSLPKPKAIRDYPHFEQLWRDFLTRDDEYRSARWKVFPHLARGSWVVSTAMGTRPTLLAAKMAHQYHITRRCTEIDCDVSASFSYIPAISTIIGLLQQFATSLAIDVAFAVEARSHHQLPEIMLGIARIHYIDPSRCPEVAVLAEAS